MEVHEAIMHFFTSGGFFMFPIAIVSAVGVLVALERLGYLTYTALQGKRTWRRVLPLLDEGRFFDARELAAGARCAMGDMLAESLRRLHASRRRDDLDLTMEQSLDQIMPRLERHTHYLPRFANIAILTGLAGTLVAFAAVFAQISQAHPSEQADLLAAGVAVSINPAAFGLIVAVPLLLIHTFLQTLTTDLMDHFEIVAVHFSDLVTSLRTASRDGVPQHDAATERRKKPDLRIVKPSGETVSA